MLKKPTNYYSESREDSIDRRVQEIHGEIRFGFEQKFEILVWNSQRIHENSFYLSVNKYDPVSAQVKRSERRNVNPVVIQ